jgi:hypothetical protein
VIPVDVHEVDAPVGDIDSGLYGRTAVDGANAVQPERRDRSENVAVDRVPVERRCPPLDLFDDLGA